MDVNSLSAYAEKILKRYSKSYVTDEQLLRYLGLGAITPEEYTIIYETKHPSGDEAEQTTPMP